MSCGTPKSACEGLSAIFPGLRHGSQCQIGICSTRLPVTPAQEIWHQYPHESHLTIKGVLWGLTWPQSLQIAASFEESKLASLGVSFSGSIGMAEVLASDLVASELSIFPCPRLGGLSVRRRLLPRGPISWGSLECWTNWLSRDLLAGKPSKLFSSWSDMMGRLFPPTYRSYWASPPARRGDVMRPP